MSDQEQTVEAVAREWLSYFDSTHDNRAVEILEAVLERRPPSPNEDGHLFVVSSHCQARSVSWVLGVFTDWDTALSEAGDWAYKTAREQECPDISLSVDRHRGKATIDLSRGGRTRQIVYVDKQRLDQRL